MRIGVLGGGQLGRMLALAGMPMGLRFRFLDPAGEAIQGLGEWVKADYDDHEALLRFCEGIDVATYEFENIPLESARFVSERVPLRPGLKALEVSQDRLIEKEFLRSLDIPTAEYRRVSGPDGLGDGILKTRRSGYDGKGQWRNPKKFPGVPCILEQVVPFDRELALLGVRGLDGEVRTWPWIHTKQGDHLLRSAHAPVEGPPREELAHRLAEALDYVGVFCLEMFEVKGKLIANELAPRVHNSGHWTIEGAPVSQFENHLRAILGWPLGAVEPCKPCSMVNFIDELPDPVPFLERPGVHFHAYQKSPRPGRKMGHVTEVEG